MDEITKRIPKNQIKSLIGDCWIQNKYGTNFISNNGWKLHISGTSKNGGKILDIVLPILNSMDIVYKFVVSADVLRKFSKTIQKGKLMTIYPETDGELVVLAMLLDVVLTGKGFKAPHILTDRVLPYGKSNLVYYRNVSKDGMDDRISGIYNQTQEPDPFTGETFKEIPKEELDDKK